MNKQYFVYIMTDLWNSTLYTGMTNDLLRRVREHKRGAGKGFSFRYHTLKLVYFEIHPDACHAKIRERQIKAGSRKKKIALIESINPYWKDLSIHL